MYLAPPLCPQRPGTGVPTHMPTRPRPTGKLEPSRGNPTPTAPQPLKPACPAHTHSWMDLGIPHCARLCDARAMLPPNPRGGCRRHAQLSASAAAAPKPAESSAAAARRAGARPRARPRARPHAERGGGSPWRRRSREIYACMISRLRLCRPVGPCYQSPRWPGRHTPLCVANQINPTSRHLAPASHLGAPACAHPLQTPRTRSPLAPYAAQFPLKPPALASPLAAVETLPAAKVLMREGLVKVLEHSHQSFSESHVEVTPRFSSPAAPSPSRTFLAAR